MYRACVPALLTPLLITAGLFALLPVQAHSVPVLKERSKLRDQRPAPRQNNLSPPENALPLLQPPLQPAAECRSLVLLSSLTFSTVSVRAPKSSSTRPLRR